MHDNVNYIHARNTTMMATDAFIMCNHSLILKGVRYSFLFFTKLLQDLNENLIVMKTASLTRFPANMQNVEVQTWNKSCVSESSLNQSW